ncbi:hypothetical protein EZS27_030010 [termite gut metagenome]|uniref:Uncharacterized protein n=1 Tax=termite gut metagenome TaxID=433724 RepID=A0A5J4QF22_9ZZZZ
MLRLHGMKVTALPREVSRGRVGVFFGSLANNCREKSADAIVESDTSLPTIKKDKEVSRRIEGQNFKKCWEIRI